MTCRDLHLNTLDDEDSLLTAVRHLFEEKKRTEKYFTREKRVLRGSSNALFVGRRKKGTIVSRGLYLAVHIISPIVFPIVNAKHKKRGGSFQCVSIEIPAK